MAETIFVTSSTDWSSIFTVTPNPKLGEDFVIESPPLQLDPSYSSDTESLNGKAYIVSSVGSTVYSPSATITLSKSEPTVFRIVVTLNDDALRGASNLGYVVVKFGSKTAYAELPDCASAVDEPDWLKATPHLCLHSAAIQEEKDNFYVNVIFLDPDGNVDPYPVVGDTIKVETMPLVPTGSGHTVIWEFLTICLDSEDNEVTGNRDRAEVDPSGEYPGFTTVSISLQEPIYELWAGHTLFVQYSMSVNGTDVEVPVINLGTILAERPEPEPEPEPDTSDSSSSSSEEIPAPPVPKTRCQLLNDVIIQQVIANKE